MIDNKNFLQSRIPTSRHFNFHEEPADSDQWVTRLDSSPVFAACTASNMLDGLSPLEGHNSPYYDHEFYEVEPSDIEKFIGPSKFLGWSFSEGLSKFAALSEIATEFVSEDSDGPWSFWREWYQGFLDGKPLDWELQRRVALIPDEDWEKGPEHIAGIIEKIRLEFRTAVSPRLVRDEDQGIFLVETEDALPADVLEFSCERIESALQNALKSSGENGLREDSYETVTLRRALDHHFGRASLLATGFFDACLSLQKTIGDRYPDDAALINLQNALYAVVEEINEQHPEARARCARLATLARPEPITSADRAEIALVPGELAGELGSEANTILESDVEVILSQEHPPKSVRARFTNWVTTVSQWMDKVMKGDKRAQWLSGVVSRLVRWWSGSDDEPSE